MKITLIGATGFVGSAVLQELLNRGHQVKAVVRDTAKLAAHANLIPVQQDIFDIDALAKEFIANDAVISAFNPGWGVANQGELFIKGHDAIVSAAKQTKVPYFLEVGGAGALFVAPNVQLIDTPDFPAEIKDGANGARMAYKQIQAEKGLAWTFICPPVNLAPGERTGKYILGDDYVLFDGDVPAGISVADLAVAIVDEIENKKHLHKRFTVASAK